MMLTSEELMAFAADGMLVKRSFVSPELVTRARSLVEDWYQHQMKLTELPFYTQTTFAPELTIHPALIGLFSDTGVANLARALLGDFRPVETAQVQIRVPERNFPVTQPEKAMHVDGIACPHLDPEELRTFSLLVGVVLSRVAEPTGGALRYVQGGHLRMAEWFRSEWSLGLTEQTPPRINTEIGIPFLGDPGDVLLMHHLVPHSVGRNHTTKPRIMTYFRVSHVEHANRRLEALRNPWVDYAPIATLGQLGRNM